MAPLNILTDAGLTVTADGDRLLVYPRQLLTDHLRSFIRDNKTTILAALSGAANDTANTSPSLLEQDGSPSVKEPSSVEIATPFTPALQKADGPQRLPEWDERRTCRQCRNLSDDGRCLAAWRGELLGVIRDFEPIIDMLQRCASYAPGPDDIDQREGRFAAYCISKMKHAP